MRPLQSEECQLSQVEVASTEGSILGAVIARLVAQLD